MAIKRKIKAASKPIVEQTLKPRPKPSQLDLVRSPNFDAAMALQDYANLMRDQRARFAAGEGTQADVGTGGTQNFDIDYIEGGQRNAPMTPTPSQIAQFRNAQQGAMAGMQNNPSIYDSLRDYQAQTYPVPMNQNTAGIGQQFGQIAQGIGRLMPQIPQGQQQMQSYQNFLNQGMNNMASVNQGAAENFANTQPGMPTTGSAQQFTANPAMPVAGMGAQKSRPTPRKFSTVSNSPARFG